MTNGEWVVKSAEFRGFVKSELDNQKTRLQQIMDLLEKRELHYEDQLNDLKIRVNKLELAWVKVTAWATAASVMVTLMIKDPVAFVIGVKTSLLGLFK